MTYACSSSCSPHTSSSRSLGLITPWNEISEFETFTEGVFYWHSFRGVSTYRGGRIFGEDFFNRSFFSEKGIFGGFLGGEKFH